MKHKHLSCVLLAAACALPLALSGCSSFNSTGLEYNEADEDASPANEPNVPPQNSPTQLWRSGYWHPGDDGEFIWIPGKMLDRPAPTAVWNPARWVRHDYGWTYQEGHWQ
ncbi:MAG: hypothetical protein PHE27_00800 [Alphaproteobacteria bacterium]|nr:hypothetical protein [Alphaproteobacteria bacterium]